MTLLFLLIKVLAAVTLLYWYKFQHATLMRGRAERNEAENLLSTSEKQE